MVARPSDEENNRQRDAVLLLACDALLQDVRRTARKGDWRVAVLQQLHRTLIREMRAGAF